MNLQENSSENYTRNGTTERNCPCKYMLNNFTDLKPKIISPSTFSMYKYNSSVSIFIPLESIRHTIFIVTITLYELSAVTQVAEPMQLSRDEWS